MPQIDVLKLCEYFEKSNIFKFEYTIGDEKIVLKKEATKNVVYSPAMPQHALNQSLHTNNIEQQISSACDDNSDSNIIRIKAPLVGVFYSAPSPEDKPFVIIGDSVKKGQTLCLLEAMKMMSEVTSPVDGVIKNILVSNEGVVGFDDVLFEVEKC